MLIVITNSFLIILNNYIILYYLGRDNKTLYQIIYLILLHKMRRLSENVLN